MSSIFDSAVYSMRKAAPFANPSIVRFMKEAADFNGGPATLIVQDRPSVASRRWWTLTWSDQRGDKREVSAQELDLCAWRAVQVHKDVERLIELESNPVTQGPGYFGHASAGWENGDGI